MSQVERALGLIKEMKALRAVEGLKTPVERTEFEFGRLTGLIQGLEEAEQLLTNLQDEDDDSSGFEQVSSFGQPLIKTKG